MGLNVKAGSFNIGTGAAGTTVAVSGIGFTPKAIIFWWTGRTESTDEAGRASIRRGVGFATSNASFRAVATYNLDGVGTTSCAQGTKNTACIFEMSRVGSTATAIGWADIQSMDAGGFTLEILDAFDTDLRVHYLALGGTDIDAEIVTFTPTGTAPVNQTIATTLEPKALFFIHTDIAVNAVTSKGYHSLSFATALNSYQFAGGEQSSLGSGAGLSGAMMGEILAIRKSGTTASSNLMDNRATLVSMNSPTGFTVNWTERGGNDPVFALILSGTFQVHVGEVASSTSTGTITETGIAFQPTALMMASHGKVAEASDAISIHERLSLGATDGTVQICQSHTTRQGNTDTFSQMGVSFDTVYQSIDETNTLTSGGIQAEASFTSFTSDGFTLNMSDADVVAALIGYIAFAPAGGAGFLLEAQSGSIAVSGVNASLLFKPLLTAQPGTVGIAGESASLLFNRFLTAQPEVVPITGVSASLFFKRFLTAQFGVVPITGVNASLDLSGAQLLEAQPGAIPVIGINANLFRGNLGVIAQPGVIGIVGINASLLFGNTLGAQPGVVNILGQNATLRRMALLTAQTGTVTIIGVNATLSASTTLRLLTAQAGAISVTGMNASLRRTLQLAAQSGTVILTGQNATLFRIQLLLAQTGAVPIIGTNANLIGVEPGAHSTDLIYIALDELRHNIETPE